MLTAKSPEQLCRTTWIIHDASKQDYVSKIHVLRQGYSGLSEAGFEADLHSEGPSSVLEVWDWWARHS